MEQTRMLSRGAGYVALLQTILLLPAALFMGALGLRTIPMFQHEAQGVVLLYAGRVWTLWVLLLALPLCVVGAGSFTIVTSRFGPGAQPLRAVAVMTVVALATLAIVVVHMLAN